VTAGVLTRERFQCWPESLRRLRLPSWTSRLRTADQTPGGHAGFLRVFTPLRTPGRRPIAWPRTHGETGRPRKGRPARHTKKHKKHKKHGITRSPTGRPAASTSIPPSRGPERAEPRSLAPGSVFHGHRDRHAIHRQIHRISQAPAPPLLFLLVAHRPSATGSSAKTPACQHYRVDPPDAHGQRQSPAHFDPPNITARPRGAPAPRRRRKYRQDDRAGSSARRFNSTTPTGSPIRAIRPRPTARRMAPRPHSGQHRQGQHRAQHCCRNQPRGQQPRHLSQPDGPFTPTSAPRRLAPRPPRIAPSAHPLPTPCSAVPDLALRAARKAAPGA